MTQLNVKLSNKEKIEIEQIAKEVGVTVSFLLRKGSLAYGNWLKNNNQINL
jgi:hypothetical protein